MPIAAEYFVGVVGGEPVCHLAVCPAFQNGYYRGTRLVVMPEWRGAGVGTRFLEWVCEYHKAGNGRTGRKLPVIFHTSHPQLIGYLRHSKKWVLKSQAMFGVDKSKSGASIRKSGNAIGGGTGYGGHTRAIQGFKYIGDGNPPK